MEPQAPLPDLVDAHCHLTWETFREDLDAVVARMREAGVAEAVVVATGVEDAGRCRDLCAARPGLHPTAGIHPNDVPTDADCALAALEALLREEGWVAVGETGLDYFRDHVERDHQQAAFRRQARLARERDLPLVVHVRDREGREEAYEDVARLLEEGGPVRGVMHCFTGSPAFARRYLELGMEISFSGILTFPAGGNVREAARAVPIERTMVETDAPFLAPLPHRGKRNEPAWVAWTARALAEVKGLAEADVRRVTARNARALFGLADTGGTR